jgi:hypothetical protein
MNVFKKLSFNEDEIEDVEDSDLAAYPDGPAITLATSYPQGILMKTKTQPGVWYVEDGIRHPLVSALFLPLYFQRYRIHTMTQKTLDSYTLGDPYKLHDGELVRTASSSAVYVVENSILRPIPSNDIFETVGWKQQNVITVPPNVIAIHQIGKPFTIVPEPQIQVAQANQ